MFFKSLPYEHGFEYGKKRTKRRADQESDRCCLVKTRAGLPPIYHPHDTGYQGAASSVGERRQ